MKIPKLVLLVGFFFVGLGLVGASAQAFFPNRVKGTFEVKFLPPAGGQFVQVSIDDQPAGTLPLTVYVLPGAHKFSFSAPGENSKTMTLPINADTVVPSLFTTKGFPLAVTTNVPASLALDGKAFAGNTVTVTPGNHTLQVTAPGYQTMVVPFTMPNQAHNLSFTLVANTFPLTVNTNVPGAALSLDGAPFGGNLVQVSPGNHTLQVTAPGYQTMVVPFAMPSQAHTLSFTLVANTFPLTVNTNVPGAALSLDGVPFRGNLVQVSPGNHTLQVTAPGYQTMVIPFAMPGQAHTLSFTLVANTFPLTVNTNVPGAALSLDGAPFGGNLVQVTPGNHTLQVTAPGYQTMVVPFAMPGQAHTLSFTLVALTGTVQVNVDRLPKTGAPFRFFVNGVEAKGGLQPLPPGAYNIRITSGNLSLETTVQVVSGQNLTLTPSIQWDVR